MREEEGKQAEIPRYGWTEDSKGHWAELIIRGDNWRGRKQIRLPWVWLG
jgi:hypothetical protein